MIFNTLFRSFIEILTMSRCNVSGGLMSLGNLNKVKYVMLLDTNVVGVSKDLNNSNQLREFTVTKDVN